MNRIQSTIAATFVTISMTTAVFAADTVKPVVAAQSVQPSAAEVAAKRRAANLRERSRKAKAGSGTVKKAAAPVAPVTLTPPATPAAAPDSDKPVVPIPPVVAGQSSAAEVAAKRRAANLRERSRKAKAGPGSVKKAVVAPVAPVTVK